MSENKPVPEALQYADRVEPISSDRYVVEERGRSYLADSEGNELTDKYDELMRFFGETEYFLGQRGSTQTLLTMDGEWVAVATDHTDQSRVPSDPRAQENEVDDILRAQYEHYSQRWEEDRPTAFADDTAGDRYPDSVSDDVTDDRDQEWALPWTPMETTFGKYGEPFGTLVSNYAHTAETSQIDIQYDEPRDPAQRAKDARSGKRIAEAEVLNEEAFTTFFRLLSWSTSVQGAPHLLERAHKDRSATEDQENAGRLSITAYDTGDGITFLGETAAASDQYGWSDMMGADSAHRIQATAPYREAIDVFDQLHMTT